MKKLNGRFRSAVNDSKNVLNDIKEKMKNNAKLREKMTENIILLKDAKNKPRAKSKPPPQIDPWKTTPEQFDKNIGSSNNNDN